MSARPSTINIASTAAHSVGSGVLGTWAPIASSLTPSGSGDGWSTASGCGPAWRTRWSTATKLVWSVSRL